MVPEKHSANSIWKVEGTGAELVVVISVDRLDACTVFILVCASQRIEAFRVKGAH